MKILGISAFYHDSAACIIVDGEIIAAVQEERFSRLKNDPKFPIESIKYCLKQSGLKIGDLDAISYYEKPLLKFERLLYSYLHNAPKGYMSFLKSMPIWIKEKLLIRNVIKSKLHEIDSFDKKKLKLLFPEHHLSHAASTYYASGYERSAILTIDGVGEWNTTGIFLGEGNSIKKIVSINFPDSLGLLYSAFTYYLGFKVNSGEYKMMGLAPYGDAQSEQYKNYKSAIQENLVDIKEDGSFHLDQRYFSYTQGLKMCNDSKWENLFGIAKRQTDDELETQHCNLALAIQHVTEEVVLKLAKTALVKTGSKNLCIAGGVALNCVANGRINKIEGLENLFITPASGDAGGALGAAYAAYHIYFDQPLNPTHSIQGSLLGPEYAFTDIVPLISKYNLHTKEYHNLSELYTQTATIIAQGNVVGWYQGKLEFGPRALGNRSILGDPRNEEMQRKLNLKIKNRESFRPFAPAVLEEDVENYFEIKTHSPYMLLVDKVKNDIINDVPENYSALAVKEKLYLNKSKFPAITHVDMSARIQTVNAESNSRFYNLLKAFKQITGHGILINTSFNIKDEPIVNTPEDAIQCFLKTDMDFLVLNNYLISKKKDGTSI